MRRTVEIVSVNGNASAGTKKTIIMPVGLDYIHARLAGQTAVASDISILQELLNTEIVRNFSGTIQNNMNLLDRMADMSVDNILAIPFEMMGMKNPVAQYGTTRNTASPDAETGEAINNMQLQWTDATADTWRVFADVDDSTTGGPGGITRFQSIDAQVAASSNYTSSIQNFTQFGSPERRYFRRGLFLATAGTLANGDTEIQRGNGKNVIFQRTAVLNVRALTDANVRNLPAAYATASGGMIIDTTETGISETFDTMREATDAEAKADKGLPVMGGKALKPYAMFNIVFSPTVATSLDCQIETIGRL
jgi:hypothetical protein